MPGGQVKSAACAASVVSAAPSTSVMSIAWRWLDAAGNSAMRNGDGVASHTRVPGRGRKSRYWS
jgi:hypothetical protein